MKNTRLFHNLRSKTEKIGKKYNYSLLAEVFALLFLGISEHPMTPTRWVILAIVLVTTFVAFVANE